MKLLTAAAAALLALAVLLPPVAQARPEPTEGPAAAGSSTSTSHDTDTDTSSGETAPTQCPPRQPELEALEAECARDDKSECTSTTAPTTEPSETTTEAMTTETAPAAASSAAENSTPAAATAPKRRPRKRSCNYHLCVLKKLEVLDGSDMPDKTQLSNWIANNITDQNQREKLQHKLIECTSSLKDIFGETADNSKSTEEDTADEKKSEDMQPKKKSCVAAKKVMTCLLKTAECPVLKI